MTNLLKLKKISETPFRKEVLAIFNKYNNAIPLTVIEQELETYNRITLYRTIKIFLEKGIIHEIALNGNESNYAICKEECNTAAHNHQHIHFKCKKCDVIYCVEIEKFPSITLPNYTIENVEIQATGICENCNT